MMDETDRRPETLNVQEESVVPGFPGGLRFPGDSLPDPCRNSGQAFPDLRRGRRLRTYLRGLDR